MGEDAVDAAREKLLAGLRERGGDGRPYARPGDPDLWLSATGARVAAIIPMDDGSAGLTFAFERASGWYRTEDGEQRELPDRLPWFTAVFAWAPDRSGYFSGTLWALWTWMDGDVPVDIYAAAGKWTVILAPGVPYRKGAVRSAQFPTILPPGSDLEIPSDARPAQRPDEETIHRWIDENKAVIVGLYVFDEKTGTSYVRQWVMPKHRAEDFAGMMTHRFGEPAEAMADMEAAGKHADEVVRVVGSGGVFGDCDCGDD